MTTTLVCTEVEKEKMFDCKIVVDGEVKQELTATRVKINSKKEDRIDISIDLDSRTFIAATDDYLECKKESEGVIACSGKREEKISKERYGIFER